MSKTEGGRAYPCGTRGADPCDLLRTRRLAGPQRAVPTAHGEDTDAVTKPPSVALATALVVVEAPAAPAASEWDASLFRLAVDSDAFTRELAYDRLASAVHHFLTDRLDAVSLDALRSAAGVLRRLHAWALDDAYSVSTLYNVERLARAFQAWHHFRELARAVDVRHDLLVRMRGGADDLILRSLFTDEGREILASHVAGFLRACSRVGLWTPALRRSERIAAVLTYKTQSGAWQAEPSECLRLCTDIVRELGDDATLHALRGVALAAWTGLSLETNNLRDCYQADTDADCAALLAEIDERFAALLEPRSADVIYFPGERTLRRRERGRVEAPPRNRFVF